MDFSTHPITLAFEDKQCELNMKLPGFDALFVGKYAHAGELLSNFLNRHYYPDLITLEQLQHMGMRSQLPPDGMSWHYWLDYWDHEKVDAIVRDIYFSGNRDIEALKPSQRFRIHLAFQPDMFACDYVEQFFAHPHLILACAAGHFVSGVEEVRRKKKCKPEQARYVTGCRLAEENHVVMPRQVQYWFTDPGQLVIWLLRYVMEEDLYINQCAFCGRYFVPQRKTKKYCSEECANKQRAEDSFCGVLELRDLYKRIVANLTNKEAQSKKHKAPYYSTNTGYSVWLRPADVLKRFYSKNADYMNELRDAYEVVQKGSPSTEDRQYWEDCKRTYLEWLQQQYDYATSLKLIRDA